MMTSHDRSAAVRKAEAGHDAWPAGEDASAVRLVTSASHAVEMVRAQKAETQPDLDDRSALPARSLSRTSQLALLVALLGAGGAAYVWQKNRTAAEAPAPAPAARSAGAVQPFVPSAAQLATFTVVTVAERAFQVESATEGKIGVDEDRTTPVFSPYAGRVMRLVARPGQIVAPGEVLFTVQATDMVQAQTDAVAASGILNKSRSQLQLAQIVERRQRELFDAKAVAQRELQAAQNDLVGAQNDVRAAEGALDAVRNRLTILGKSDMEIAALLDRGRISSETPIGAPIGGTVIARKVGPGQYVSGGSGEPAYTVGDLSRVWLLASVRESEAPRIRVGQEVRFRVLAFPDQSFSAKVTYVGASIDPASRRVLVRAEVGNAGGLLKPEMFASIRIATGEIERSPSVPREAVIYEGDTARIWVLLPSGAVELRPVKTGLVSAANLQILSGVASGERIIARGSLFIDRLATSGGE